MFKCIILFILVTGSLAEVAPFIKPCHQTDSDCMLKSALIALPHMVPGIPELGLAALDPLVVDDIEVNSGELKLKFTNVIVHGLGKCKINKIERDPPKSTALFDIDCPIKCVGEYTADGKLLFVDIEGKGPFEIQGDNLHVANTVNLKEKENKKTGKKHYKITGFDFVYEPKSTFSYKLDNLYGGDKAKAEPVEQIMKESWKELIMDENIGKPVIKEIIVQVVRIISKLFQIVPSEELEIV